MAPIADPAKAFFARDLQSLEVSLGALVTAGPAVLFLDVLA